MCLDALKVTYIAFKVHILSVLAFPIGIKPMTKTLPVL